MNSRRNYYYARNIIKGRFIEGESTIALDPEWAFFYALHVIRGRFREAEPTIAKDPNWAYHYAKDVIKGRWPQAESVILNSRRAEEYREHFNIQLEQLNWSEVGF